MYATGITMLALSRMGAAERYAEEMTQAIALMEKELNNPYPDGPRYNRHGSSDAGLPEFRNNLYTNAGHMWAFLATTVYETGRAPWGR